MTRERNERFMRICKRARELWEDDGRPLDRHDYHWLLAMQQIDAEDQIPSARRGSASHPPTIFSHAIEAMENVVRQDDLQAPGPDSGTPPKPRSSRR